MKFIRNSWRLGVIILVIILAIFPATVCLAVTANPDSGPTINAVYAYHDLAQTGDQLYLIDETTTYASPPSQTFTQLFVVRLIAADGTTILATAIPSSFFDSGYNRNVIAIYFNTATAPTWNQAYTVQIIGNPLVSWSGSTPLTSSSITWWSPLTGLSLNEAALASQILTLASNLDTAWGYGGTSSDLLQSTSVGPVLSTVGQSVFLGILPGLVSLAPAAFSAAISNPNISPNPTISGTLANGTGTATFAPINLGNGGNLITVTGGGSFTVTLQGGTAGTATSGTPSTDVTGSPVALTAGANTINVSAGTFTIDLMGANTKATGGQTLLTPWDPTGAAAALGLSSGWAGAILTFGIIFAVDIWLGKKMKSNKGLILIDDFIFVACTIAGFLSPAIIAVGAVVFALFTVNALFFSKSYA